MAMLAGDCTCPSQTFDADGCVDTPEPEPDLDAAAPARPTRTRTGDSVAPVPRVAIATALTIPASPELTAMLDNLNTPEYAQFEHDFSAAMAESMHGISQDEIEITAICMDGTCTLASGRRRRRLQEGGNGITVEFEIVVEQSAGSEARSAAMALQQQNEPLPLTLGGVVVEVTPSSAMAPPSEPVTADIDCEGSWACSAGTADDTSSCFTSFTLMQAPSGEGRECPAPPVCKCVAATDAGADDGMLGIAAAVFGAVVLGFIGAIVVMRCFCARRPSSPLPRQLQVGQASRSGIELVCGDSNPVVMATVVPEAVAPISTKGGYHSGGGSGGGGSGGGGMGASLVAGSGPAVGAHVQVYSKSKNVWCQGRVLRVINSEAVEVEYLPPGGRTTQRKSLRMDSANLSVDA